MRRHFIPNGSLKIILASYHDLSCENCHFLQILRFFIMYSPRYIAEKIISKF
jgi:hypothetical protein